MGMFDTFYGTYKCPKCGNEVKFEEQTKDYDCCLIDFKLGDYVDKANASHFYNFEYDCPFCGEKTELSIGIKKGQYVGIYYTSKAQKMNVDDLENIEEGYQRKREYEKKCRIMLGEEDLGRIDCDIIALKMGGTICALGKEWQVIEAYKEEYAVIPKSKREAYFKRFFYQPTFVYRVNSGNIYRIITTSLNRHMLTLRCDVYEDGFDEIDEVEDDETFKHKYHLQSGCRLKRLDDDFDNRIALTKRINLYYQMRRKIKCISNSYDVLGDGNYRTIENLEVGKEYTLLPHGGYGNSIHIEELPSSGGYPESLFEELEYYCEDSFYEVGTDFLLRALEKSEEDVRQGRVKTAEEMFLAIRNKINGIDEAKSRDRIAGYIDVLSRVWNKHPDLRFGQLIQYALIDQELWNIDDDMFFESIAKYE